MRYGFVSLGPCDKNGRGPDDLRHLGCPEPSWRWTVGAGNKVVEAHSRKPLLQHQFAIGVRSGAEKMGKRTSFDAAQLTKQWLIPDVYNAYNELDREKAVNEMCENHPCGDDEYSIAHCAHRIRIRHQRRRPTEVRISFGRHPRL